MAAIMSRASTSMFAGQRRQAPRGMAMRTARPMVVSVQALLKTKAAPAKVEKRNSQNGNGLEPKQRKGLQLGFTKDNELFVGRAAMLGFAFSLIGELVTGKGALAQLGYEIFDDKIGTMQVNELVIGLIAFNLIAAILPASGTFVPDEEVASRPQGSLQNPKVTLLEPKKFFGLGNSGFGFTKENELFVGRVAQLGFAASLIGESLTGKGALEQFNIETGIPLMETGFGLAAFILFFLAAAINPGSGKFVNEEEDA